MLWKSEKWLAVSLLVLAPLAYAQGPTCTVVIGEELPAAGEAKPGKLNNPFGIDFDAAGNMYLVELAGGRVHKLSATGEFSTIAGDGSSSYTGDGGPAKDATFNGLHNLAALPNGDLFIADSWNNCIRKIDGKTGMISTFAGTGEAGFAGDGGPASEARFNSPMCVTLDPENGKIYVADLKNLRVRMIDLGTNVVTTVAGNGEKGVPKDGGVAVDGPLVDPRAVAVDSQDNIYILERGGHALRKVNPDGLIHTVAGTGEKGTATGLALKSQMNGPKHLAVDQEDRVIIADEVNARICLYDPVTETLTAILGAGVTRPEVHLRRPHGVCVHEDGSIYVADSDNHRILRLVP